MAIIICDGQKRTRDYEKLNYTRESYLSIYIYMCVYAKPSRCVRIIYEWTSKSRPAVNLIRFIIQRILWREAANSSRYKTLKDITYYARARSRERGRERERARLSRSFRSCNSLRKTKSFEYFMTGNKGRAAAELHSIYVYIYIYKRVRTYAYLVIYTYGN